MDKKEILDILDNAKDERGAVPMRLVRQAFNKLPTIQPVATDINVGDIISRQAAIDGKISIQCANGVEIYSDEAVPVEYLKALPSAQPEQIWIPCSERLPEESGYYIITAHDGVGHRTTFVKYQKKAKSWDLTGVRSYWRVIAWMPLPEPYREDDAK